MKKLMVITFLFDTTNPKEAETLAVFAGAAGTRNLNERSLFVATNRAVDGEFAALGLHIDDEEIL